MKLIGNLEELAKGDLVMVYYKRDWKGFRASKQLIGEIKQNNEALHIKGLKYIHKELRGEKREEFIDKKFIISKIQEKIKKRKLRHKKKSFNGNYVIFKLSPSEKNKLIKEAILEKLE